MVGVGEGLAAGLGGRELLAVVVQDGGEHAQRRARLGRLGFRGGDAGSFGRNLVVPGQFGRWPRPGHRVGKLGGQREHVRVVGVGAAGQRDVGVLAVLGPGDHRQAGVHGPAHGDVIGDRVPEFRIAEMWIQESAVGPPPLPSLAGSASRARRTTSPPAVTASIRSRSPLASARPGSPASTGGRCGCR